MQTEIHPGNRSDVMRHHANVDAMIDDSFRMLALNDRPVAEVGPTELKFDRPLSAPIYGRYLLLGPASDAGDGGLRTMCRMAMAYEIRFHGDRATFRSRRIRTPQRVAFETTGEQPPQGHFGEAFKTSIVHLVAKRSLENPQNVWKGVRDSDMEAILGWHTPPMIQATQWAGRLFCAADGTVPMEVDSDFSPVNDSVAGKAFRGPTSAHMTPDPNGAELWFVRVDPLGRGVVESIDQHFQVKRSCRFDRTWMRALRNHDLAVSSRHLVLGDAGFNVGAFRPTSMAKLGFLTVLDKPARRNGRCLVQRFPFPALGFTPVHVVYAIEDPGGRFLHVGGEAMSLAGLEGLLTSDFETLAQGLFQAGGQRWFQATLDLKRPNDPWHDFALSADHFYMQTPDNPDRPRWVFGGGEEEGSAAIVQLSLADGELTKWKSGPNWAHQVAFAPAEDPETLGWVIFPVSPPGGARVSVFRAGYVGDGPVAEAELPGFMPLCIHSRWLR